MSQLTKGGGGKERALSTEGTTAQWPTEETAPLHYEVLTWTVCPAYPNSVTASCFMLKTVSLTFIVFY